MAQDPPICRRIVLMRHGHYDRVDHLGDTVWGLSPLGRRQAVNVGRRLLGTLDAASGRFEGIYASPWPRAYQSAEIAAHQMALSSIRVKRYLHELVPLVDPTQPVFKGFACGLEASSAADRTFVERTIDKIHRRFFKRPSRHSLVLIFTHGNIIRYLVARTLGLPYEAWATMDIAHASITELRVYAGGFETLVRFNDIGHLPPSMVTTT